MKIITSDELLARTDETNMDELDKIELVKVICVDGSVVTTNRHVQYMHAFLHFNRAYDVPVHKCQVPAKDFVPTPKNHKSDMTRSVNVVHAFLKEVVPKHEIAPNWIYCNDALTNACIADIEHFGATIDALDIVQIQTDPQISKMRTEMKNILAGPAGPEVKSNAIIDCNVKIIDNLKNNGSKKWPCNGTVQHIECESIKLDSLCQIANVVGLSTEIDSEIYPMATAESFSEGMNYPYTYAINASLGKKSIMYNKSPISDTETLNRLVQQMTSQIENIHVGDCGSTLTIPIFVNNIMVKAIRGMYHLTSDGEVELVTEKVAKKYHGKMIYLRSVAGCQCGDERGTCSVCGGAATQNFVKHYTVGGASSCLVLGKNSQIILKTKHVDIINFSSESTLSPELHDFMRVSDNGKEIYVNKNCAKAEITFLACKKRADDKCTNGQFLQTVFSVKSLDGAQLTSFGEVSTISIKPNNGLDDEVPEVRIKPDSTANFSYDLLCYIRENPDKLVMSPYVRDKTAYTVNLDGFDIGKPVFSMPFKHYDSLTLHNQLEAFFLSPNEKLPGEVLTDYNTFGEALTKLTKLTYDKLGVPAGVLQMLIIPFTLNDRSKGDYRMSRKGNQCEFGKMEFVRRNRSLSVVTIATGQGDVYGHLGPLVNDKMTPHQYDGHFCS